jgi:hypothetical protein
VAPTGRIDGKDRLRCPRRPTWPVGPQHFGDLAPRRRSAPARCGVGASHPSRGIRRYVGDYRFMRRPIGFTYPNNLCWSTSGLATDWTSLPHWRDGLHAELHVLQPAGPVRGHGRQDSRRVAVHLTETGILPRPLEASKATDDPLLNKAYADAPGLPEMYTIRLTRASLPHGDG